MQNQKCAFHDQIFVECQFVACLSVYQYRGLFWTTVYKFFRIAVKKSVKKRVFFLATYLTIFVYLKHFIWSNIRVAVAETPILTPLSLSIINLITFDLMAPENILHNFMLRSRYTDYCVARKSASFSKSFS